MAHVTWQQAFDHAYEMARWTGHRYRVYKSRSVIGWWNTVMVSE